MEIGRIFKRIQQLEAAIKHCVDKNQAACLMLIQQPTLKQARNSRLQTGYYSIVTFNRSETAICDLRRTYDAYNLSLEEFYKTKLEPKLKDSEQNQKNKNVQTPENVNSSTKSIAVVEMHDANNGGQNADNPVKYSAMTQKSIQFRKDKADLAILEKVLNCFEETKKEAESIEMPAPYLKIEQKMAKSFYNMMSQVRSTIQQKIPLLILCRMMTVIKDIASKRMEERLAKKEQKAKQKLSKRAQKRAQRQALKKYKLAQKKKKAEDGSIKLDDSQQKQKQKKKKRQDALDQAQKKESDEDEKEELLDFEGNDSKQLLDDMNSKDKQKLPSRKSNLQ